MKSRHTGFLGLLTVLCIVLFISVARAADGVGQAIDLTALSLDQLANLEVTSVSRRPEKTSKTSAAVYVITQEDIRRSGVTTIAEALRLAPGVQVSRAQSNKWAVGLRGFASVLSRAVLVLIDGRSVYNPLFAGTYWEVQDMPLEDIERIEVNRGPSGALWGANAFNGVINIITKSARDTHGSLLVAGGGSEERAFGTAQYGGQFGERFHYRYYGKYFDRDDSYHPDGAQFDDTWNIGQGGFRTDWDVNDQDLVTVQSDLYSGKAGQLASATVYNPPSVKSLREDANLFGANILSRWQRIIDESSDFAFQIYYDRTHRRDPNLLENRNTVDVDFQHRFPLAGRQDLTWGSGFRVTSDRTDALPTIAFGPASRTENIFNFFIQDELSAIPDRVRITLGTKVEHNDYSGWEVQPSARAVWTPNTSHTLWSSVSRAVRTPSRIEHDLQLTGLLSAPTSSFARLTGDDGFVSEKVIAYEMGYRVAPLQWVSLDLAGFYNDYSDLLSVEQGPTFPEEDRTITAYSFKNGLQGESHGAELAMNYQIQDWWQARASYSYLNLRLRSKRGSADLSTEATSEGSSPRHQFIIHSAFELPKRVEVDPVVRYVDHLRANNIPSYWETDLRLGWRPTAHILLDIVGQNLLQKHHPEFTLMSQIERSVYAKATLSW